MLERTGDVHPPRGLWRWLARLPIWLYRARLGWLLGDRFLLLNHIGRRSGKPRQAALEVVRHDKATGDYYVAAGFGEKSDRLLNIGKTPRVVVQVGLRQWEALAERLTQCVVVEDAAAGIEAAKAGGFRSIGLGPRERVGGAEVIFPSLDGVHLTDLLTALK